MDGVDVGSENESRVTLQRALNTCSRLLAVMSLVCFTATDVDGLPRTNNDLEHVFGSFRHHQRRCNGQKKSPASLLVRGSCRLIAAIATKIKTFTARDLMQLDWSAWRQKRNQMEKLRHNRLQQRRFRRQTETYLADLETKLIQSILPP